jgi:hypothetical protein
MATDIAVKPMQRSRHLEIPFRFLSLIQRLTTTISTHPLRPTCTAAGG